MDTRKNLINKRLDLIVDKIFNYLDSPIPENIKIEYKSFIDNYNNVFFLFMINIFSSNPYDLGYYGSFRIKELETLNNNYIYFRTNWSGDKYDKNAPMTDLDLVEMISKWIISNI